MRVGQTSSPATKDTGPSNTTPPAKEPLREQKEPPSTDNRGANEQKEPDPIIHPTSLPKGSKEPISTAPVKDKFDLGKLGKNPFFHLGRGSDDDDEEDDTDYVTYKQGLYEGVQNPTGHSQQQQQPIPPEDRTNVMNWGDMMMRQVMHLASTLPPWMRQPRTDRLNITTPSS